MCVGFLGSSSFTTVESRILDYMELITRILDCFDSAEWFLFMCVCFGGEGKQRK